MNDNNEAESGLDKIVVAIGDKLSWLFLISVLVSLIEVFLRYIFNSPTVWAHETTILFCAICFVYGGAYCIAEDRHIRISIVYDLLGQRAKRIIDFISLLLCSVYLAAMTYSAWFVAKSSLFGPTGNWQPERSGSAWDPAIPAIVRSCLFLILLLMLAQFVLRAALSLKKNNHA